MNEPSEAHIIEMSIEAAKERIAMADSLERLLNNEHFIKVFMKGYIEDNAIRLVKLKASPNVQSNEHQLAILNEIDAIGAFNMHMRYIRQEGELARKALKDDEEALEEILSEEA